MKTTTSSTPLPRISAGCLRSRAIATILARLEAQYSKAVHYLVKDPDELLAFCDVPADHWQHLRTTKSIESTFATVWLRHRRTKGSGTRVACLAMLFKLSQAAERKWRKITASLLLRDIIEGVAFKDGAKVDAA